MAFSGLIKISLEIKKTEKQCCLDSTISCWKNAIVEMSNNQQLNNPKPN